MTDKEGKLIGLLVGLVVSERGLGFTTHSMVWDEE